jgi:hypothetical protein
MEFKLEIKQECLELKNKKFQLIINLITHGCLPNILKYNAKLKLHIFHAPKET